MFKSMRVVSRGAMLAYLGLAILSGLGVRSLTESLRSRFPRLRTGVGFSVACALLLFEMNAAPLRFERGEVNPDAVTLRLKRRIAWRERVAAAVGISYRYMLRAADSPSPNVGHRRLNHPRRQIENLTQSVEPEQLLICLRRPGFTWLSKNGIPPNAKATTRLLVGEC